MPNTPKQMSFNGQTEINDYTTKWVNFEKSTMETKNNEKDGLWNNGWKKQWQHTEIKTEQPGPRK